jgi:hypothetical protein
LQCKPIQSLDEVQFDPTGTDSILKSDRVNVKYKVTIENGSLSHDAYIVGFSGWRTTDKGIYLAPSLNNPPSSQDPCILPHVPNILAPNQNDITSKTFTIQCSMKRNNLEPMDMGFYVYYPDTKKYAVLRLYLRNKQGLTFTNSNFNNKNYYNYLFTLSTNEPLVNNSINGEIGSEKFRNIDYDAREYYLNDELDLENGSITWSPKSTDGPDTNEFPFDIPKGIKNKIEDGNFDFINGITKMN